MIGCRKLINLFVLKDFESRKIQKKSGREFIVDEAEVSGPDSGDPNSENDCSDVELLQESFIDNEDMDYPTATQHAAYLKDIRSPAALSRQRFFLLICDVIFLFNNLFALHYKI